MIIGIILAAGKGKRMNSHIVNKVTLPFIGKPLILYGVELFQKETEKIIVVVGAFSKSVKEVLKNKKIIFAHQKQPLGTGDALRVATDKIKKMNIKPSIMLVGYGDHMMFYNQDILKKMIKGIKDGASCSLVTTFHKNPTLLGWGRIIRDKNKKLSKIVEQKDCNPQELKVEELNAGLYAFSYSFAAKNIKNIKRSPVTGEYYINELIDQAIKQKLRIDTIPTPFENVGIGINTLEQYKESKELMKRKLGLYS